MKLFEESEIYRLHKGVKYYFDIKSRMYYCIIGNTQSVSQSEAKIKAHIDKVSSDTSLDFLKERDAKLCNAI